MYVYIWNHGYKTPLNLVRSYFCLVFCLVGGCHRVIPLLVGWTTTTTLASSIQWERAMPIRQYLRVDFDEIDGILGFSEKKNMWKDVFKKIYWNRICWNSSIFLTRWLAILFDSKIDASQFYLISKTGFVWSFTSSFLNNVAFGEIIQVGYDIYSGNHFDPCYGRFRFIPRGMNIKSSVFEAMFFFASIIPFLDLYEYQLCLSSCLNSWRGDSVHNTLLHIHARERCCWSCNTL